MQIEKNYFLKKQQALIDVNCYYAFNCILYDILIICAMIAYTQFTAQNYIF